MFPRKFHPLAVTAAIAPVLSNAGSFDPELFMQTSVQSPLSTKIKPIPPNEYTAIVDEVKAPRVNANGSVVMDVIWSIDDEALKAQLGRQSLKVRQALWLDIENGMLSAAEGKNVGLGRLREALGQNTGAPWSPQSLKGGVARIKVVSDLNKDTGDDYGKVVAVTKLS